MADRVKLLVQKRTTLNAQITSLTNILDEGQIDNTTLKLRIVRLTELYHAYEDFNDELAILDSNDEHQSEFLSIQERFYSLAGRIENILNVANASGASTSDASVSAMSDETHVDNTTNVAAAKRWQIKLPEASLPTFDGKFENWLLFKNAFINMIGSQDDLLDQDKLYYLKSALTGEAANKIKIFANGGLDYSSAWELLERAYDVKRILISRHLSLLMNAPAIDKESTNGLMKLADNAQQHVASLKSLGVTVGPEIIVHVLESKLPRSTLDKWDTLLEKDEFPKPEQMYDFLYNTAICASRREMAKTSELETGKGGPPAKRMRSGPPNRALVKASHNCIVCKTKKHPLYLCDKFKGMPVSERIEAVRNAKLCFNCLRSHLGTPCKFSSCTICQKRHNTLLHLEKQANKIEAPNSDSPQPVTTRIVRQPRNEPRNNVAFCATASVDKRNCLLPQS